MARFILSRLLNGLAVMLGVVSLVFYLFQVLPGDGAQMTLGQRADLASLQSVRRELGLDLPPWQRYLLYMNDLSPLSVHPAAQGRSYAQEQGGLPLGEMGEYLLVAKFPNLRRSYQSRQPVTEILAAALPGTLLLAFSAMLIAGLLGITLGSLAARHAGTAIDRGIQTVSVLGISVPSFFAAILISFLFGHHWRDWTGLPMTGSWLITDPFMGPIPAPAHLILPAITLGIRPLAIVVQLTRSSVLDILNRDFIRTARAKGLREREVYLRHILPNALPPVVTAISGWLASLLAGSVFVEFVFGWHGLGKVTVDALMSFDLPVVMGCVLLVALFFVLINFVVDLIHAWLDPRIRLQT
jgi:peptide/nickel transport system permease protein